jgi:hypothetical protein
LLTALYWTVVANEGPLGDVPAREHFGPITRELSSGVEIPSESNSYKDHLSVMSPGRTIGLTGGGYLALLPKSVMAGDLVCIFLGCNVPLVLRRAQPRHFILIGDCYVHDVMNGEVIEDLEKGTYQLEEFILQ